MHWCNINGKAQSQEVLMNLHLQTEQFVLGSEEAIVARDDSWCR